MTTNDGTDKASTFCGRSGHPDWAHNCDIFNQNKRRYGSDLDVLDRAKTYLVEGYVWCDSHTEVHEDTLDPYGEGYQTCLKLMGYGFKKKDVHRELLVRRVKGDLAE